MENRVIKFRGLGIKNNWMFGYLIKQGAYYFIQNNKGGNDVAIQNTIGQFTGLTDKNGKEVYEGDILNYLGAAGAVFYDKNAAMFMTSFNQNRSSWSFDSMHEEIEVIGNIHENPELLK